MDTIVFNGPYLSIIHVVSKLPPYLYRGYYSIYMDIIMLNKMSLRTLIVVFVYIKLTLNHLG